MITEPFVALAAAFAASIGVQGYRPVVLPHPVSSRDDAALEAISRAVAEEVADRLLTPTGDEPGA